MTPSGRSNSARSGASGSTASSASISSAVGNGRISAALFALTAIDTIDECAEGAVNHLGILQVRRVTGAGHLDEGHVGQALDHRDGAVDRQRYVFSAMDE